MTEFCLFYIGLSLFLIHEMDAIRCEEWKMFPVLSSLSDRKGYIIFTTLHIPIFIVIFWFITNVTTAGIFTKIFDVFMIIHFLLHLLFLNHEKNKFKDVFSWSIITGIAICGLFDLILFR
ncbi:MAG: hypothetical protein LBV71_15410 [Prevotella sp.]|nr:hypothetical protein [Prevotella sp.]